MADRRRPAQAGRDPYSRRKKRGSGDRTRYALIRLSVCIGVFLLAVLIKLVFPGALDRITGPMKTSVDLKAAFATLGEGISGEKNFTQALGEAFVYAFRGDGDTVPAGAADSQTSPPADTPPPAVTDSAAPPADVPATSPADAPPPVTDGAGIGGGAAAGDSVGETLQDKTFARAVIESFDQNPQGYYGYSIPAGVTYEVPAVGAAYFPPAGDAAP